MSRPLRPASSRSCLKRLAKTWRAASALEDEVGTEDQSDDPEVCVRDRALPCGRGSARTAVGDLGLGPRLHVGPFHRRR